jgi:O-antigen/teichoic acid export membrane protein
MKLRLSFFKGIDIKSMMVLASGTLLSGFIPLLFEPFFKGKFTPEEYGFFDLFLKASPILALCYTFKSEILIASSKSDKSLFYLKSSLNQTFFTFLLFLIIAVFVNNSTFIYSVFGALFFSIITITTIYFLKKGYTIHTAFQKPIRRLFELLFLLFVLNFSIFLSDSLIFSSLLGLMVSSLFMLVRLKKEDLIFIFKIDFDDFFFSNFFKLKGIFLSELLNIISLSFLTFFVFSNYSSQEMGFLELSNKFISIPQLVFTSVIGLMIQNRIGILVSEKISLILYIKKIISFLIVISILVISFYYVFIEVIVDSLFDSSWSISSSFVILLLPHLFFFIIFSPLSRILYGMKAERELKKWQFLKSLIILSTAFFYWLDISAYLLMYSVFSSITYALLIYFLLKAVKRYEFKIVK